MPIDQVKKDEDKSYGSAEEKLEKKNFFLLFTNQIR
jgi:hypothetical protein